MKKLYLLTTFLLLCATISFGKSVSVGTARTVAYNYLHQKNAALTGAGDLHLSYTSTGASTDIYIFSGTNCFVLVAADDAVIPVLGYATEHAFVSNNMTPSISGFLAGYNKQIDYIISKNIVATADIAGQWNDLINNINTASATRTTRTTSVTALLSTTWDQYPYYNADCPVDAAASSFGGKDVTGCVATAMAQVMKYWAWPAHGVGLNSYTISPYGTLSADFGASTYDWTSMPLSVTAPNAAVAKLMSDAGISVNMGYTPTESSAYVTSSPGLPAPNCAEYALKTYFNYDPSLHGEVRASYSDATWISMLEADLDLRHPVIYTGQGTAGGHCFIFDGYDASNNFHVNWGWSGTDNGYFTIDALNPAVLGIGGGGGGFDDDQTAILGIKPLGTTTGSAYSLALYDYVNLSASTIAYVAPFNSSTNIANSGSTTFTGDFCAAAFDATSGAFITFIDSAVGETLPSGDVFSTDLVFTTSGLVSMVPGTYTIGIFYRPTGGSWAAVPNSGSYTNFAPMTVVNHNYIDIYSAMSVTPNPLVEGAAATVTLNIYNNSGTAFDDSVYLGLYNLDGTPNCDIQSLPAVSVAPFAASGTLTFHTSSITATPGSYILVLWFKSSSGWALAGTDYFENPVNINVVAPALTPDIYEVNNTAATAYNLTPSLVWSSDVAHTSTPGANFHITADEDYYKLVLPSGYNYTISARVNDLLSTDDGLSYAVDAIWSYSTDGGATWSAAYDDIMTGTPSTINLTGMTGGTVIFHVSHAFAGSTGTYLLKIGSITRVNPVLGLQGVSASAIRVYPNPANEVVTVDLTGTGVTGISAKLSDISGRAVLSADLSKQTVTNIQLGDVASGIYMLEITTDAGVLNKKITVSKN